MSDDTKVPERHPHIFKFPTKIDQVLDASYSFDMAKRVSERLGIPWEYLEIAPFMVSAFADLNLREQEIDPEYVQLFL